MTLPKHHQPEPEGKRYSSRELSQDRRDRRASRYRAKANHCREVAATCGNREEAKLQLHVAQSYERSLELIDWR